MFNANSLSQQFLTSFASWVQPVHAVRCIGHNWQNVTAGAPEATEKKRRLARNHRKISPSARRGLCTFKTVNSIFIIWSKSSIRLQHHHVKYLGGNFTATFSFLHSKYNILLFA
jgi:hypothetical protein